MLLFGIGAGSSFMPLSMTILSGVRQHEAGAASGLLQTVQQTGGSVGIAILVSVFGSASRSAAQHPLANVTPRLQAHAVIAFGMTHAFSVATIFAVASLLVALVAIRSTTSNEPASFSAGL